MMRLSLLLIILLGTSLAIFGVYFVGYASETLKWLEIEGSVVKVQVRTYRPNTGGGQTRETIERRKRFYPEISYRWTVDGVTHQSSRYQIGSSYPEKFKERAEAEAVAERIRSMRSIPIYYNPQDPSMAVLDRSVSVGVYVPLVLGIIMAGCGFLGLRQIDLLQAALAKPGSTPGARR